MPSLAALLDLNSLLVFLLQLQPPLIAFFEFQVVLAANAEVEIWFLPLCRFHISAFFLFSTFNFSSSNHFFTTSSKNWLGFSSKAFSHVYSCQPSLCSHKNNQFLKSSIKKLYLSLDSGRWYVFGTINHAPHS